MLRGMSRVFSYERVSSRQQVTGRGLGRQSDGAQQWAARHGLTLDTSLQLSDAGRSASKGHHLSRGALGRFLNLAQSGQLGPSPLLLVEAIDRLSRQEPLDAIETILSGLVGSGVRIVTLEDGAEYSRETLRTDPTRLIVLVVKIQAAYEYSARLAMRMKDRWEADRAKLEAKVMARPNLFCPGWCEWTDQGYVVIPEKAALVRKVFELLRYQGCSATSRDLNAQGLLTPSGNRWTNGSVRTLAMLTDGVYGAIRLRNRKHYGTADGEVVIEGMLPVIVPKEEVLAIRGLINARGRTAEQAGPNGLMRWVGQRLSYCVCGARLGLQTSGGSEHRYLFCRHRLSHKDGCRRSPVPLLEATAHLLRRLEPEALLAMVNACMADDQVEGLRNRADHLRTELAGLDRKRQNLQKALVQAAEVSQAVDVLAEQLKARQQEAAAIEQQLRAVEMELAMRQKGSKSEAAREPLEAFRQAFALGEDTREQRHAVNRCLVDLGLRIVLDGDERRMGLQLGSGPVEWQTLRPLDRRVLWAGARLAESDGVLQEAVDVGIAHGSSPREDAESR